MRKLIMILMVLGLGAATFGIGVVYAQTISVAPQIALIGNTGPEGLSGASIRVIAPDGVFIECLSQSAGKGTDWLEVCRRPSIATFTFTDFNNDLGPNQDMTFAASQFSGAPGQHTIEIEFIQVDTDTGEVIDFTDVTHMITIGSDATP